MPLGEGLGEGFGEGEGVGVGDGVPVHFVLSVVPFPGQRETKEVPGSQGEQLEHTISLNTPQGAEIN